MARGAKKKQVLLVAGMHRSGTSALTRVLNLLGADLPATLLEARESNAPGFWESPLFNRLNDEILQALGLTWRDWQAFDQTWYEASEAAVFREKALKLLGQEFGASELLVLKDPRVCRLLPFWYDVLEEFQARPLTICTVRSPLEVAASLRRRNGLVLEHAHLIWLRYTLDMERYSRGRERVFIGYDGLLGDWRKAVDKIAAELKIVWPQSPDQVGAEISGFLSRDHRHHINAESAGLGLPEWLTVVFDIVSRWGEGQVGPGDTAELDRVEQEIELAQPAFVKLTHSGAAAYSKLKNAQKTVAEQQRTLAETLSAKTEAEERLSAEKDKATEALVQLHRAEGQIEEGARTREALERRLADAQTQVQSTRDQIAEMRATLRILEAGLEEAEARARSAESDALAVTFRLERTEAERDEAKAGLIAAARHQVSTETALAIKGARLEDAQQALADVRRELSDVKGRLGQRDAAARQNRARLEEAREDLAATRKHLDEMAEAHHKRDGAARENWARLQEARGQIDLLQRKMEADRSSLMQQVGALEEELALIRRSFVWRLVSLFGLGRKKRRPAPAADIDPQARVAASPLFDKTWYIAQNPDVAAAGLDPVAHYCSHGWKEGRNPGPDFSGSRYLERYPDVAEAGIDPLLHYIQMGQLEERELFSVTSPEPEERTEVAVLQAAPPGPVVVDTDAVAATRVADTAESQPAASPATGQEGREQPSGALPQGDAEESREDEPSPLPMEPAAEAFVPRSYAIAAACLPDWVPAADLAPTPRKRLLTLSGLPIAIEPSMGGKAAKSTWSHSLQAIGLFGALSGVEEELQGLKGKKRVPEDLPVPELTGDGQLSRALLAGGEDVPGDIQLVDLWYTDDYGLRLRFGAAAGAQGVVRCFQHATVGDGALAMVAEAAVSGSEIDFVDVPLLNPYAPLLLVLTSPEGGLHRVCLLPFPSLCRDGAHYGELCISKEISSYRERLVVTSQQLLAALLAARHQMSGFRVRDVVIDLRHANGSERLFAADMAAWLGHVLHVGLSVAPLADGADAEAHRYLKAAVDEASARLPEAVAVSVAARRETGGCSLLLPADCLPTLRVLVEGWDGAVQPERAIGSFVLVNAAEGHPALRVTLPPLSGALADLQPKDSAPVYPLMAGALSAHGEEPGESSDAGCQWPVAIRFADARFDNDASLIMPVSPDVPGPLLGDMAGRDYTDARITVLLPERDWQAATVKAFLESLSFQAGASNLDIVAAVPASDLMAWRAAEELLDRSFRGRFTILGLEAGQSFDMQVRTMAAKAEGDFLLVVGDNCLLHDPRTLETLAQVADNDRVASVGCVNIAAGAWKNRGKVFFRTGGAFVVEGKASQVRIEWPDTRLAFPCAVYPVVANRADFFMVKTGVWRRVSRTLDGEVTGGIDFGMAAHSSGFRHLCTSIVSVGQLDSAAPEVEQGVVITPEAAATLSASAVLEVLRV